MNRQHNKQTGFTLMELMLAMAFVAMLLLAIAAVVLQIAGIYNKGTTMKAVNQASRSIVTDMRRVIGESRPFDVTTSPQGVQPKSTNFVLLPDDNSAAGYAAPRGGRLCTGSYTYIWNIGTNQENVYQDDATKPLRFIRVNDSGGRYCADHGRKVQSADNPTEMFGSDTGLAVQCFQVNQAICDPSVRSQVNDITAPQAGAQLYNIRMIISNADQDVIDGVGRCKPPSDNATMQNYCAVNEIDFTVSAGNGGGQ